MQTTIKIKCEKSHDRDVFNIFCAEAWKMPLTSQRWSPKIHHDMLRINAKQRLASRDRKIINSTSQSCRRGREKSHKVLVTMWDKVQDITCTKSYCFRCMWCDKITVSHIKHFKTELAVKLRPSSNFCSCSMSSFTRFSFTLSFDSFERRHLAKPFKSHYSFFFWLISKSLNIHDSVSRPLLFFC